MAYESEADETFFGGGAGGGKSDLLLGMSYTTHEKSIIFRRTSPEFESIEERSKEIMAGRGHYNHSKKIWRFNGKKIEFASVEHDKDKYKYQGRPHDLKGFDEITNFSEGVYLYLCGWLRTNTPGQRCRVVCTGNPPSTAEGRWVIRRWGAWIDAKHPNPAKPGELRWYAMLDGEDTEVDGGEPFVHEGETIYPKSRTFIPALVQDNPVYMATNYLATLQAYPEPLRSQLLYGDFKKGMEDAEWQIIPTEWVELAIERGRNRKPEGPITSVGVDPSRGGKDATTIAPVHGNYWLPITSIPGALVPDGKTVLMHVLKLIDDKETPIHVDVVGVGSSPFDAIGEVYTNTIAVNSAAAGPGFDKSGKLKFSNLRAKLWWKFREALDPETGEDIALPDDSEMLADLTAPTYKVLSSGIRVEEKKEMKKRIGRSPDKGEAVLYAYNQYLHVVIDRSKWGILTG